MYSFLDESRWLKIKDSADAGLSAAVILEFAVTVCRNDDSHVDGAVGIGQNIPHIHSNSSEKSSSFNDSCLQY